MLITIAVWSSIPIVLFAFATADATNEDRNSDDTIANDIPPDGEGYFCDHPSNPGSCYDRNDNPESFCVNHQQYTKFCEIIGPICTGEDVTNAISSTDPECTEEGSPCPDDYIRYGEYCARHRTDCISNYASDLCNGKERSDGLLRCDEPDHPGYKFCENNNDD
jgi:hypothetical protein